MRIERGEVRVLFAFDIGDRVRLEACGERIADLAPDERIRHKGRAPGYFQFSPAPLRLLREVQPPEVGGRRPAPQLELLLFEFGGVSAGYTVHFEGPLEDAIALARALVEDRELRRQARASVERVLELVAAHVDHPRLAEQEEDYLVFLLGPPPAGAAPLDLLRDHAPLLARLVRAEDAALSDQEIQEALAGPVCFGPADVALSDWSAALSIDAEPEDVVSVLEFANLQLLELRLLDARLDRALEQAYDAMAAPARGLGSLLPGSMRPQARHVAELQVDAAVLYERVSNALKLLGDQYLARVYRGAAQRFRVAEWNAAILRKLDTLESVYQKLHDDAAALRMEALEWIIILLIAVSIALPFLGLGGH